MPYPLPASAIMRVAARLTSKVKSPLRAQAGSPTTAPRWMVEPIPAPPPTPAAGAGPPRPPDRAQVSQDLLFHQNEGVPDAAHAGQGEQPAQEQDASGQADAGPGQEDQGAEGQVGQGDRFEDDQRLVAADVHAASGVKAAEVEDGQGDQGEQPG